MMTLDPVRADKASTRGISFPKSAWEAVDNARWSLKMSRSALVREAIATYFESLNSDDPAVLEAIAVLRREDTVIDD